MSTLNNVKIFRYQHCAYTAEGMLEFMLTFQYIMRYIMKSEKLDFVVVLCIRWSIVG